MFPLEQNIPSVLNHRFIPAWLQTDQKLYDLCPSYCEFLLLKRHLINFVLISQRTTRTDAVNLCSPLTFHSPLYLLFCSHLLKVTWKFNAHTHTHTDITWHTPLIRLWFTSFLLFISTSENNVDIGKIKQFELETTVMVNVIIINNWLCFL